MFPSKLSSAVWTGHPWVLNRQVNELFQDFTSKKKLKGTDKDVSYGRTSSEQMLLCVVALSELSYAPPLLYAQVTPLLFAQVTPLLFAQVTPLLYAQVTHLLGAPTTNSCPLLQLFPLLLLPPLSSPPFLPLVSSSSPSLPAGFDQGHGTYDKEDATVPEGTKPGVFVWGVMFVCVCVCVV